MSIKNVKAKKKKTKVKGEKSNLKTGKYAWIDKNCESKGKLFLQVMVGLMKKKEG